MAAINNFGVVESYLKGVREVCCCFVECLGVDVLLVGLWTCEECYGSRFGGPLRVLSLGGKRFGHCCEEQNHNDRCQQD